MVMYQALDNFSAEMADGSSLNVAKGAVFHEGHELVKRDNGRGVLFQPLDSGGEAPVRSPRKAAAKKPAAAEGA